jgi:hypothetical protein
MSLCDDHAPCSQQTFINRVTYSVDSRLCYISPPPAARLLDMFTLGTRIQLSTHHFTFATFSSHTYLRSHTILSFGVWRRLAFVIPDPCVIYIGLEALSFVFHVIRG